MAVALFSLRNAQGQLVSEAAVGASQPIRRGRLFVEQAVPTGVALANPFEGTARIALTLRDQQGSVVGTRQIELQSGRHLARFVSEEDLFGPLMEGFTGSLTFEVEGSPGVGAVTVRQSQNLHGEPLFAALPVVDLDQTGATASPGVSRLTHPAGLAEAVVFPHLGAGSSLSTQILLINPHPVPVHGELALLSPNGQPLTLTLEGVSGSTFPYDLEPNGVFSGTLTSSTGVFSGFAIVTVEGSSPPPAGTAIFQYRHESGSLISEAGVGAIPPTGQARVFVDTVDTQTGVAIANPHGQSVSISVRLLDRFGNSIDELQTQLGPHNQRAVFVEELFGGLAPGFTGLLELEADRPIVPITLKLTFNGRGDPILTTLPVADLQRPSPVGMRLLPQVGFGGDFSTRLILIGAEAGGVALDGTVRFTNSDGTPLRTTVLGQPGSVFEYAFSGLGAIQLRPGNSAAAADIVLNPSIASLPEITVNAGNTVSLSPVVLDTAGSFRDDFQLEYTSLDEEVANVDAQGRVTAVQAGFSTLTVRAGGILKARTLVVAQVEESALGFDVDGISRDLAGRLFLSSSSEQVIFRADDLTSPPEVYAGIPGTPGFLDGQRLASRLDSPSFLALNQANGSLYFSDSDNHAVRMVSPGENGRVTTLAGDGQAGYREGEEARFNRPAGVALDSRGRLWVADSRNQAIRRIDLGGGAVELVAGAPGQSGHRDGNGMEARFDNPFGIALEVEPLALQLARTLNGDPPPPVSLLVADRGNRALRRVFEDGRVETVAAAEPAPATRGAFPGSFQFSDPTAVAVDSFGNTFVGENGTGEVYILTRNGSLGRAAERGTFNQPFGLSITRGGELLVAEQGSASRRVTYGRPVIEQVDPEQVDVTGGVQVTVRGRNFAAETLVVLGSAVIDDLVVEDSGTLRFVTPPLESGLTTLSIQHRGGVDQRSILVRPPLLADLPAGYLTTVAGGADFVGDGLPAVEAVLSGPAGLALDRRGDLFVSDTGHNRVRRIDSATGVIFTVAGTGRLNQSELSGDGGPAIAADLGLPLGLAFDTDGSLLVADSFNNRIRRIDPATGMIETVVGSGSIGSPQFGGDGGPANEAFLDEPSEILVDENGDYLVSDSGNRRVRRVERLTGLISTIAGNGCDPFDQDCPLGEGGPAQEASLGEIAGLARRRIPSLPLFPARDRKGARAGHLRLGFIPVPGPQDLNQLFIADSFFNRLWTVNEGEVIGIEAGDGSPFHGGDGGPADEAGIAPSDVVVEPSNDLLVADRFNDRVRRISLATGIIETVAGCDIGVDDNCQEGDRRPATQATLFGPAALEVEGSGGFFVAEAGNRRIRRVSPDGVIETFAGTGERSFDPEGGPAAAALLSGPAGIVVAPEGILYFVDTADRLIWGVDLETGTIRRVAGSREGGASGDGVPALEAQLQTPTDVTLDSEGNLYVSTLSQVRRIDAESGLITTVAGNGRIGFSGDGGPALEASLFLPGGIVFDDVGDLFIADVINRRVRRVDASTGIIDTVVGNGCDPFSESCSRGDGGPATEAALNPTKLAFATDGALLVVDDAYRRIRRVDPELGTISTIAGNGSTALAEGVAATDSGMSPSSIAVDADGNIWIVDVRNRRIRRIDGATGLIRTVGGTGAFASSPDGGPALESSFGNPTALALDREGNIFFTTREAANSRIRAIKSP